MNACCKLIINYKSIIWLLVAAILLVTLQPAHYHLHHLFNVDSTTHHAHAVDLHFITDSAEQSHHEENATVVAASPYGIVKKSELTFSAFALLAVLLVLLPIFNKRIRFWLNYNDIGLKYRYSHYSPPLRAPPLP